jgi:hypothetical protein
MRIELHRINILFNEIVIIQKQSSHDFEKLKYIEANCSLAVFGIIRIKYLELYNINKKWKVLYKVEKFPFNRN